MACTTLINDMPECLVYILRVVVAPLATLALAAWLARIAVRHRYVMLLLGLLLLIVGCAAWSNYKHLGFFEPVCNALPSFFLSRGDYDWPFKAGTPAITEILYDVFHVAVICYVLSILLAFFGIELVNRFSVTYRVVFRRQINVFWGCSKEAQCLAESMAREGRSSVVFALHEARASWMRMQDADSVHALSRRGWNWVRDDPGSCRMLLHAERHFFLGPDGQANVADAEAVLRRIHGNRKPIKLYVRIGPAVDGNVLYTWADRWNSREDVRVEVVVVREEALVSRRFVLRHPMLQSPRIDIDTRNATVIGDFKVLVLGFGSHGRTILNDVICDSQYLTPGKTSVPFEAHVFDKDASSYGTYEAECQEAVSRYHIKFNNVEVGTSDFWRQFRAEMARRPYNRVVVCLPDDRENISVASDIARIYREVCISPSGIVFARVRSSKIGSCVESTFRCNENGRSFIPFGLMDETYSFDSIVTRKWEMGAQWLNGDYNKRPGEPHDANQDAELWRKTSSFNKESSRESFFHQRNLLRLVGYRVDEASDRSDCFNDDDPKNHLDVLAEVEHMRWMAFHFVRGVKVWKPTGHDIEERIRRDGKAASHNAIADINAHADLVDYPELPSVDEKFDAVNARFGFFGSKSTQEKDKGFVRSEAMRQSGLGIMKCEE